MPFADLSSERDQEYFTIGLTEELVNGLARLPDLRVATYKLKSNEDARTIDARTIGQQMRVATVLEGSVTKAGSRVRSDKWTAVTEDGKYSAHFEHTVAITAEGPWVLTRP